jgi:hypothetical protein
MIPRLSSTPTSTTNVIRPYVITHIVVLSASPDSTFFPLQARIQPLRNYCLFHSLGPNVEADLSE